MKRLAMLLAVLLALVLAGCGRPVQRYQAEYWEMFDTPITFTAYAGSQEEFDRYSRVVHSELLRLHRLFDVYHDYEGLNNLKTVNDCAGGQAVAVDAAILDLLEFAREVERETGGAVNVAFGPVLRLWHDCREAARENPDQAAVPPPEQLHGAAEHTSMDDVVIDRAAGTIQLAQPGMCLDVGALAKGYAAGAAMELAKQAGMTSGLLNAGGNVVAVGVPGDGRAAWNIGVQSPVWAPDGKQQVLDTVELSDLSAVSSGDYQRFYEVDGVRYHHIIDPQTLYPAAHARAVTVLHPDSAVADFLSTACFVLPYDEGEALLERYGGEAIWMLADGDVVCTDGYTVYSRNFS